MPAYFLPQLLIAGLFGPDRWSRVATSNIPDRSGRYKHDMVCMDDYLTTEMWFNPIDETDYVRFVSKSIHDVSWDYKDDTLSPSFVILEPTGYDVYTAHLIFKLADHTEISTVMAAGSNVSASIYTLIPAPGNITACGKVKSTYHQGQVCSLSQLRASL